MQRSTGYKKEESTDEYYVGFGNLSLTDEEFQVLQSSFIENKGKVLEFEESRQGPGQRG